ncbi:methyl-accepting chemotaxis protein [Deltaproteobacteria bacterium TL4]
MKTMTVGKKIIFGFLAIILLVSILGIYTVTAIQSLRDLTNENIVGANQLERVGQILNSYSRQAAGIRGYLLTQNDKFKKEYQDNADNAKRVFAETLAIQSKEGNGADSKLSMIHPLMEQFASMPAQAFAMKISPENDKATHFMATQMEPLLFKILEDATLFAEQTRNETLAVAVEQTRDTYVRQAAGIRGYLLNKSDVFYKEYKTFATQALELRTKILSILNKKGSGSENKVLTELLQLMEQFDPLPEKAFELRRSPKNDSSVHYMSTQMAPLMFKIQEGLTAFADETRQQMEKQNEELFATYSKMYGLNIVILLLVLGSGLGIGIWVARDVSRLLKRVVNDLGTSAENLAAASEEISSSSQTLSSGASEQAASLEETSSSMEEISIQTKENVASAVSTADLMKQVVAMVKDTEDHAHSAADLSQSAKNAAENGVQSMGAIAGAMREIREGSEKITDIIEVINEITHQTKMLATNAAIEAARAGDQGKGFAVVADEVSKLAENSKKAAKEIAGLIRESVRKAESGNDLAVKGESALQEILKQARQVSDLIQTISSAATEQSHQMVRGMQSVENIRMSSEEQANGVEQINRALMDMDNVTQANAANAEETASASEELASQAMGLRDLVEELSRHVGITGRDNTSESPVKKLPKAQRQRGSTPTSMPTTTSNQSDNARRISSQHSIAMRDDFKEF